jgi:hypothetical protein
MRKDITRITSRISRLHANASDKHYGVMLEDIIVHMHYLILLVLGNVRANSICILTLIYGLHV